MHVSTRLVPPAIAAILLCGVSVAHGQVSSAEEDATGVEEVLVTAQKRSQSIQDVSISITAISGNDLEERGIRSLADVSSIAPSVALISEGQGRSQLVMRGLATAPVPTDKPTLSEGVGIYFDDVPVAMALRNPDLRPVDLNRIEVLRGPQGTLYGGGALGGAIKLVANSPDVDETQFGLHAEGAATSGTGLSRGIDGYVNVPLVDDKIALRVTGYHSFDTGFVDNVLTGRSEGGDTRQSGARAQLAWKISEQFEMAAKFIWQNFKVGPGFNVVDRGEVTFAPPGTLGGYRSANFIDEYNRDDFKLYNLALSYDLGFAEFSSSTARIVRDVDTTSDFTPIITDFAPGVLSTFYEFVPVTETMEEARLTSSGEGPWRWILGAFYSKSTRHYDTSVPAPGFTAVTGIPTAPDGTADNLFESWNRIDEKQKALFGEVSYGFTDKWTLTTGARLFKQNQTFDIEAQGLYNGGPSARTTRLTEDGVNPRFNLAYRPAENLLIAAEAAKGFRLGGGNDNVPVDLCRQDLDALGLTTPPNSFKSENVWNYELNAKSSWAGGRVTVNPTVFLERYADIQVTQQLPSCFFNFVTNAGTAEAKGAEVDVTLRPTHNFTIRAGGSYTNARLTSDLPAGVAGEKGDRLPLSPRFAGNVQLRQTFDLDNLWRAYAQVDYRYFGGIISTLSTPDSPVDSRLPVDSYSVTNLRVGVEHGDLEWTVFANNVLDSHALISSSDYYGGTSNAILRPRTIGLSLTYTH